MGAMHKRRWAYGRVGQVLQPCPSVAVGQIGLARNEIPPPYGE